MIVVVLYFSVHNPGVMMADGKADAPSDLEENIVVTAVWLRAGDLE